MRGGERDPAQPCPPHPSPKGWPCHRGPCPPGKSARADLATKQSLAAIFGGEESIRKRDVSLPARSNLLSGLIVFC